MHAFDTNVVSVYQHSKPYMLNAHSLVSQLQFAAFQKRHSLSFPISQYLFILLLLDCIQPMSGPRWVFQKPFQNATGKASGMWRDPRLKTPDCSLRNQSISNFVFRQFDSASEDENKPDPEAIKGTSIIMKQHPTVLLFLEEIFIHDLSIMEQLDEARSQIKNLQIAAKSRAETTVHYR